MKNAHDEYFCVHRGFFFYRIWYVVGTNSYYSHVVPLLTRIMGTERYIFLCGTHIRTSHGYRKVSFLMLCPDSDKPWVQRGIFSRIVPWFRQAEGTKRHLFLLRTLIRTSRGYKAVPSLSLCPFWKLSRNQYPQFGLRGRSTNFPFNLEKRDKYEWCDTY